MCSQRFVLPINEKYQKKIDILTQEKLLFTLTVVQMPFNVRVNSLTKGLIISLSINNVDDAYSCHQLCEAARAR